MYDDDLDTIIERYRDMDRKDWWQFSVILTITLALLVAVLATA